MNAKRIWVRLLGCGIAASVLCAAPAALAASDQEKYAADQPATGDERGDSAAAAPGSSWSKWRGVTGATRERHSELKRPDKGTESSSSQGWYRWSTSTGAERAAAAATQTEANPPAQATADEVATSTPNPPADPFMTGWWTSWKEAPAGAPSAAHVPGGPSVAQRQEERAARERASREGRGSARIGGYAEFASAYAFDSPGHWSKLRTRIEVAASGVTAGGHGFKLGVRGDVDAAYLDNERYPLAVRRDQRSEAMIREAYLDVEASQWAFRLGRQHIVWGEAVGMFIADVVSARDTREFILGEFDAMRIPQWAARAERFGESSHLEFVWVPYPGFNEFGEPGADFHPFPGLVQTGLPVRHVKPGHSLSETNWGLRASHLRNGWDLSAFFYRSNDAAPTLLVTDAGFELHHDRISQLGGTFSKDIGNFVLKGEAVHTSGRRHLSMVPAAPNAVKPSDTIDYVVGIDLPRGDWRMNAQVFGRRALDHDPSFLFDRTESGYTLLFNRQLGSRFEAEMLYARSFNRTDYMLRPKAVWKIRQQWRAVFGLDLFGGPDQGMFGRYRDNDRVYLETRYWF